MIRLAALLVTAVAALVVNSPKWRIKAGFVGREALRSKIGRCIPIRVEHRETDQRAHHRRLGDLRAGLAGDDARQVGHAGVAQHFVVQEEAAGDPAARLRQDPVRRIGHDVASVIHVAELVKRYAARRRAIRTAP